MRKEKYRGQDSIVLADGEVTGHAHRVVGPEDCVTMIESENEQDHVLNVQQPVQLTHEEHGTIDLPKGNYKCGIVREHDHFTEEARNVMD